MMQERSPVDLRRRLTSSKC